MTIAGFTSERGIIVHAHKPLILGGDFLVDLTTRIDSYNHDKTADDDYKSVTITIKGQREDLEEWLEFGLGRHIVTYNPGTKKIHEVFVNRMVFSFGSLTVERGPLMDVANRVGVAYTPIIDYNADPPILGTPDETTLAENLDSQAKYGILEEWQSGGNLINDGTINEADELRNTFLNEKREPITNQSVSTGGSKEASAALECLGYKEWMNKWVYNSYSVGYDTLTDKLTDILATDPNGIFSTNVDFIGTNALLTSTEDATNRKPSTIIQEIVSQGDVNDNRWFFTVGEDRICKYAAIPSTIEYQHTISENGQQILDMHNNVVEAWDIQAGKWLSFTDTLIGRVVDSDLALDPRVMFIESVRYTAPYQFQLSGAKQGLIKQRLAKLGVSG